MKIVILATPIAPFTITLFENDSEKPIFQKQMLYEDFLLNCKRIISTYPGIDEIILLGPTSYLEGVANKLAELIVEDIQITIVVEEDQKE
jgi:hypothetical protein